MSLADFRRVMEVNLVGCWLGIKQVIAPMTAAGGGSIVNISSIEGFAGAAGLSAYSASKFGDPRASPGRRRRNLGSSASGSTRCIPAAS